MPIGDDAELEPSADDACALVPRGMTGANPFALAWTVALMFVPVGDAGPEREPPGTACTDAFRTAATETPSSRAS